MFRHRGVILALLPTSATLLACATGNGERPTDGTTATDAEAAMTMARFDPIARDASSDEARTATADASRVDSPMTQDPDCGLQARAGISDAIATVVIVSLTSELSSFVDGYVEYGLDETYGMHVPLELDQPEARTLLLGLRQDTEYHYRVVATADARVCASADATISTAIAPDGLPSVDVTTLIPEQVAPGFVITSGNRQLQDGPTTRGSGTIVVYDSTGALVWWHPTTLNGISRARMSYDGRWMYARDGNPSGGVGGSVVRVSMDGTMEERIEVDTGHHDFSVTPDGGMLFLTGAGRDGCSRVEKLSASGDKTLVYDLRDAFGAEFESGADSCHCNSIQYHTADDSISVSCLVQNAYVKLSAAGELQWVLGGEHSHFTGEVHWNRNHGHQMLSPTRILFFNNNGLVGQPQRASLANPSSLMLELELDLSERTATRVWSYDGGGFSQTLGDVQRLPNGNTHVTYSNAGLMHQVDADGNLVQEWDFARGTGYAVHRENLYGPPPAL